MSHPMPLTPNICARCGHGNIPCPRCGQDKPWYPRSAQRSRVCPCCKSYVWDQPPRKARTSEIVCPWCSAACPLIGDEQRPIPFEGYGDFEAYRCSCGAIGSPSGDIGEAAWPLEDVEAGLAGILKVSRGRIEIAINHITYTDPPLLMLWGRRRRTTST